MGCMSSKHGDAINDMTDKRPLTAVSEREEDDPFFPKQEMAPFFTPLSECHDNGNTTIVDNNQAPLFEVPDWNSFAQPEDSPFNPANKGTDASTPSTSASSSADSSPFGSNSNNNDPFAMSSGSNNNNNDIAFDSGPGGFAAFSTSNVPTPQRQAPISQPQQRQPQHDDDDEEESGDEEEDSSDDSSDSEESSDDSSSDHE